MKNFNKRPFKGFVMGLLLVLISSVSSADGDRPQSVDDLWKIIQDQQKQIDMLNKKLEAQAKQGNTENRPAQDVEKTAESAEVKEVARKTDILSEEVEKLRTALVIPEEKTLKSEYGLGPAASADRHGERSAGG